MIKSVRRCANTKTNSEHTDNYITLYYKLQKGEYRNAQSRSRSRRGSIFSVMLVVMVVIALVYGIILISRWTPEGTDPLGVAQYNLLKTYQDESLTRIQIETSARLAADATVLELAAQGGSSCERYKGYAIYSSDCSPSPQQQFQELMHIRHTHHLSQLNLHLSYFYIWEQDRLHGAPRNLLVLGTGSFSATPIPAVTPQEIRKLIDEIAQEYTIPSTLALALVTKESNLRHEQQGILLTNANMREGRIVSYDVGVMQINSRAHEQCFSTTVNSQRPQSICAIPRCEGKTPVDVECNIAAGFNLLKKNYDSYKGGFSEQQLRNYAGCAVQSDTLQKYLTYREWQAALRAYNGLSCEPQFSDYVESVIAIEESMKLGGVA